ncbi:transglycosylase-like protein with SLT domain [Roseovarius halotolerans]|uniref:Transglycosylase SLT domain protein n=1 Tax=Roseovarius halotolerans TaxID=505353 RepID=A0A1X6ZIP1_9RHOB|nr:transglycosylase-like protein with SLT domain [Roseovarius halotolerans]SLN50731.1 Transglycosylase SLT domain protein [Roseovarius halotolerans]
MKLGNMEGEGRIDLSRASGNTDRMTRFAAVLGLLLLVLAAPVLAGSDSIAPAVTVPARDGEIPRTKWEHVAGSTLWTRSALSALGQQGRALEQTVPRDIADWCPAYPDSDTKGRRAFWVGFLSALAEHESTFRPRAVGGGGRWFGLLQILPSTARGYGCRAGSGDALKHGPDNLSCAIRIMARTVARDGVVSRGMRGVAADWGPLHSESKRSAMMRWTRAQTYCRPMSEVRPRQRPAGIGSILTIATQD